MTNKNIYTAVFWIFIVIVASELSYQYRTSNNDCQIVIKADGTKTAAEVVEGFQELMKGMNGG